MSTGRIYLVASGKGGTGKTSVTAGLGAALAARGLQVLCLDCDLGMRNLDLVLGLTAETALDFFDVILRGAPLDAALVAHPLLPSLFLLNGPALPPEKLPDRDALQRFAGQLRERFDVILADAPAGVGTGFTLAGSLADEALLVTTPDPPAFRDAALTARLLRQQGISFRLILNRVQPRAIRRGDAADLDSVMDHVGASLLGVIPEDPRVRAAGNRGTVLPGRASAAHAFVNIAARLCGQSVPLMRLRGGGLR